MKQDERHHTSDDFFVGIDLAVLPPSTVATPPLSRSNQTA